MNNNPSLIISAFIEAEVKPRAEKYGIPIGEYLNALSHAMKYDKDERSIHNFLVGWSRQYNKDRGVNQ